MLTEKDFCDYDTCVALSELGCPVPKYATINIHTKEKEWKMWLPLYDARRFLREEKKLHITIFSQSQESWQYRITKPHQKLEDGLYGEDFSSYEEALNYAIKDCIKYVD